MTYDYFYGQQAEMFAFYRVPKVLFTEDCFWNVSTDAKLLYGILLDRMNLSARNGWLDEEGRVYIIFTIEEIKGALGCAEKKAVKLLDELEKKCGLIERKRQGLGKPNLIYVKNFISGSVERQFLNCQKDNSGVVKNTIQELSKAQGNNTDTNYIDFSDTDPFFPSGFCGKEVDETDEFTRYYQYFYEQLSMAQSIWYLYHDLSDEAKAMGFFPSLSEIRSNGFPEETAWLAEQLKQPEFLAAMKEEYRGFMIAHDADRSLLRFHYHKLDGIEKRLNELDAPVREYQSDMMQMPLVRQFITDDEVNADLTRGSGFAGGKRRIYEYWQENHSVKDKAEFLKHEYGTGGHSHACSGATHSGQDHDAKGVRYTKSGCDKVQMSWTQVAQRIDALMKKGRFLTPEEEAERQAIEDAKTNPLEDVYERFAVVDTEDGEYAIWDEQTGTYYVDHEGVTEYFDDEWLANDYLEEVRQTVAAMEAVQPEESADNIAEPVEETPVWNYQVGDTVYLDDTAFLVEQITDREVQLRDPSLLYPIFRAESRENFERLLSQDERNHAVRGDAYTEKNSVTGENQGEIRTETAQPERRYLVAAYHHFENGFDDKLDYYTLEEAEKAAQGYVDGTMEDDGFKYDGAAVYDQQEHKCIRIYGDYPDEKAQAQVYGIAEPVQQEHFIDHFYVAEDMEDKLLKYFPAEIEKQAGYIHGFEADIKTVEAHPQISDGFCGMEIMGRHYAEKADAGEIILAACKETKSADPVPLGSYRGFRMELSYDSFRSEFDIVLKGAMSHRVALGTDARGNITRLDNALSGIPERLERANEQLTNLYNQQEAAKAELGKPFPQEAELVAKSQRLAELDAALNMEDTVESRAEKGEAERPSVLADLKSKSEHIPPAKRSEGYEEVL